MKAQKSWDTPVADETRDVSDASEDIHGITDDITDDAESAEVDAEAVTLLRKRHRRMTLLVVGHRRIAGEWILLAAQPPDRLPCQLFAPDRSRGREGLLLGRVQAVAAVRPSAGPIPGRPVFRKGGERHGRGIRRRAPRRGRRRQGCGEQVRRQGP